MLQPVHLGSLGLEAYAECCGTDVVEQLRELARPLQGIRVAHINATPYGGGVAEILRSEIPLLRGLGLAAEWKLITGGEAFFRTTKAMHNGLQGSAQGLTDIDRTTYVEHSERNAALLEEEFDIYMIHDPQPMGMLQFHGRGKAKWIWRCHIDTSDPNPDVWAFVRPFLVDYDAAVYTLGGFVPPDLPIGDVEIIPPAIDPMSPKNMALPDDVARNVLRWIGVNLDRPLVAQVSRFDPWKDPLGVIAAYRRARAEILDLQLALVGSMALDDPEGWDIYEQVRAEASADPGIALYTNLTGVGNIEVNAFQRLASVIVQLSRREGFGLIVSEALWKGTPVVARAAGGIPLQLQDGAGGMLVESTDECAEQIVRLVRNREEAGDLARRGREVVRQRFLLTRLIADELRLYSWVLGLRPPGVRQSAGFGLETRDPVCGMALEPNKAVSARYQQQRYYFCSGSCRQEFLKAPERFLRAAPTAP